MRDAQALGRGVQDTLIRLVRDDHRYIVWGKPVAVQHCLNALHHLRHRELEHDTAVLLQKMLARRNGGCTGRQETTSGGHEEIVAAASVHLVMKVEEAVAGLPRFQEHGSCSITEQHGCGPVERIDDGTHQISPDNDDPPVYSTGHELSSGSQSVEEPRASGGKIESPGFPEAELVLDQTCGGRKEHVRCYRGNDQNIDVASTEIALSHQLSYCL